MLAERELPSDIGRRIEALAAAWARDDDVAAVYLFGSRATGAAHSRSDVDLAVVLEARFDATGLLRKRLELTDDACRRLGTEAVDVIVLEDAPSVLGHRILRSGRVIADRHPGRRVWVAETVLRRYLDEARLREALDRGLAERVRGGRFAR
jgi:predicted nucleotidyltransferase